MRKIPLTHGKVALVDDEDYERLKYLRWYAHKDRHIWYAQAHHPRHGTVVMHRVILGLGRGRLVLSDHIDGDGLNNQRSNLRRANPQQNAVNRQKQRNNTSGYPGVALHKPTGRWEAKIRVNRERISLGYFNTPEEAARAYIAAALKYRGEFARCYPIPHGATPANG